jgi:hypothetical protein
MRRYVHFDANFRLVLSKKEKRSAADRSLWHGSGFFAAPDRYQEYLSVVDTTQQEVCV